MIDTASYKRKLYDLKGGKVGERKVRLMADASPVSGQVVEAGIQPREGQ